MEISFKIVIFLLFMTSFVNEHSCENYCFAKAFNELHQMSIDICQNVKLLSSKILDLTKNPRKNDITLAGSVAEGSILSRWFLPQNNTSILVNIEADIEVTVSELPSTLKHCVKDLRKKPGFVHLQMVFEMCICMKCLKYPMDIKLEAKLAEQNINYTDYFADRDGFAFPKKILNFALEQNSYDDAELHLHKYCVFASLVLNRPLTSFKTSKSFRNVTKATFTMGFDIKINSMEARLSLDISFNYKIEWIPDVTRKWLLKRNQKWPPIEDLQDELKYSYIIAKPSHAEKNNENTIEFRYSFAHIERKIFNLMSDTQRLIYFIFKIMFYKWIIPIDDDNIMSYIAKTIMLLICEEYPPDNILWERNPMSIYNAVKVLFLKLAEYCQQNFLPYFFVPQINVLDCLPHQSIENMRRKADDIGRNITIYFPNNLEETRKLGEQVVAYFKYSNSQFSDIAAAFFLATNVVKV